MDTKSTDYALKMIGVSHATAPIEIREVFAINPKNQSELYREGKALFNDIFVISTCNRTELYSSTASIESLGELLLKFSQADSSLLEKYSYVKQGRDAVNHVFRVSVGLESLILGDHEIIGQVRKSYALAVSYEALNQITTRLFQFIFNTAKRIRAETSICEGSASTSFAAVQLLKARYSDLADKKILLFGAAKIGTITCENLISHTHPDNITVLNRTKDKALALAQKHGLKVASMEHLIEEIRNNDVIIVATNAGKFTVTEKTVEHIDSPKTFIDLSVPRNVDPVLRDRKQYDIIYIDDLRGVQKEAIERRRQSLPLADKFIRQGISEFQDWKEIRQLSPAFNSIKKSLQHIQKEEVQPYLHKMNDEQKAIVEDVIGKIINRLARNMISHIKENKNEKESPVEMIEALLNLKITE